MALFLTHNWKVANFIAIRTLQFVLAINQMLVLFSLKLIFWDALRVELVHTGVYLKIACFPLLIPGDIKKQIIFLNKSPQNIIILNFCMAYQTSHNGPWWNYFRRRRDILIGDQLLLLCTYKRLLELSLLIPELLSNQFLFLNGFTLNLLNLHPLLFAQNLDINAQILKLLCQCLHEPLDLLDQFHVI